MGIRKSFLFNVIMSQLMAFLGMKSWSSSGMIALGWQFDFLNVLQPLPSRQFFLMSFLSDG